MDFAWSEAQRELYRETRDFASRELNEDLAGRDARGEFLERSWHRCAQQGILGLCVPPAYGGQGRDVMTTMLALEGLGYGCRDNGLTLALNGQMWAVQEPLLTFGSEAQKRKYLPGLCGGSLKGAHGMSEPDSGSDAFSLRTTAQACDGGYVLNGHKIYIGLGPVCDLALVFATTDPALGQWGISAFLVEHGTPGFRRGPAQQKMGLRTGPMGELHFENCRVPSDALLGTKGAGVSIFQTSMEWERSFIFASHVGAMERQLDETLAYARRRRQFGQHIGAFQSVSNRIAEMKLRLETAKLLLYKAAWMKDQERPSALEAALAKLHIAESFVASSLDSIRVHGGRGYLSEHEIERDLRDAVGGVIYSGTSDIQRQVIARLLGL